MMTKIFTYPPDPSCTSSGNSLALQSESVSFLPPFSANCMINHLSIVDMIPCPTDIRHFIYREKLGKKEKHSENWKNPRELL